MITACPDSPEAVALDLFKHIAPKDNRKASREKRAREALDLFAQCLDAVNGNRKAADLRVIK